MKFPLLITAITALIAGASAADAQVLTSAGTANYTTGTNVNLSASTDYIYTYGTSTGGGGSTVTSEAIVGPVGSYGMLELSTAGTTGAFANTGFSGESSGNVNFSYTNGAAQGGNTATVNYPGTTSTGSNHWIQSPYSNTSEALQLVQTVQAPTEIFTYYLANYGYASNVTFTLLNAAGSSTTVTPLQFTDIADGTTATGTSGNAFESVSLTLTGARAGDFLVMSDTVDTAVTAKSGNYDEIGFEAAAVTYAVPEPSTYALLGLGLTGLLAIFRFRKVTA